MRRRIGLSVFGATLFGALAGLLAGGLAPSPGPAGAGGWLADLAGGSLELERVDFVGAERLAPEGLLERASLLERLPLHDVDPEAVCEAIATHPGVRHCHAVRVPPGRLIVALEERVALAALASEGEATSLAIDAEGVRFPLSSDEARGLPRVSGDADVALPLLLDAAELGVAIRTVEVKGSDHLVVHPAAEPAGLRVRLLIGLDTRRALRSFEKLVRSGLLEAEGAREVDLRFRGNAVLRDLKVSHKQGGGNGSI